MTTAATGFGNATGATTALRRGLSSLAPLRLETVHPSLWLLCAFLVVSITSIDEEWAAVGKLEPTLLLAAPLLLLCILKAVMLGMDGDRRSLLRTGVGKAWAAFVLAACLSVHWAENTGLAIDALREYATIWMLFPAAALLVRNRTELLLVLLVVCLSEGFYLARSFQEFLNGRVQGASDLARMIGAGKSNADPNSLAATITFALPLFIWFALATRSLWFVALATAYGTVGAFSIVMTRSRSGLIMLALVGLWTFVKLPSHRLRMLVVIAVALAGVVVASRLSPKELRRYASVLNTTTYTREESTQGRVRGYIVAAKIADERPVVGIGPGNWSDFRMRRIDGDKLMPHSLAGIVLAEHGLLGMLLFLLYLAVVVRLGLAERKAFAAEDDPWSRAMASLAGTLLFILALLAISGLAAHNLARNAWWLAPGLLVALHHLRHAPRGIPETT